MRLELANFQTDEARISDTTRWSNGVLEINADEILEPIRQNLLVDSVEIEIALPGQSTRIVTVRDVIEPRVKQSGDGVAYPGILGRSVTTVGQGRTNRMGGLTVMTCAATRDSTRLRLSPPRCARTLIASW